ncbi:Gfo/Idh/MocA family oxidoreductase [Paenarthrobacter sp. CM16]|uniref:Gfo/Idh/MocA family protein n=1 Tax=Paenarthrobacter sp. CM16 TaxID=2738447 RepID=UPI00155486B0|nr:Gfo/Idh/MocA family oxidoreductase [Paenarthrobacter sp. CM16]NQD90089.1 Gfo/Idh/MocA family oxidoreductase [Paenarthrobacter sp. CM16]
MLLKAVLIGAGKAGRLFSNAAEAMPGIQIIAVVSKEGQTAANLAARHDAIAMNGRDDWAGLKPDLVLLATPHDQHASQIIRALRAGAHVASDKPLVLSEQDWYRVTQMATLKGRRVFCGFTQRCNEAMKQCKEILTAERRNIRQIYCLQNLRRDRSYYQSWKGSPTQCGGGVGINQAIHALDLALFLTGTEIRLTDSLGIDTRRLGVEDHLSVSFQTDNGGHLQLTATTNSAIENRQLVRIDLTDTVLVVVGSESPSWSLVSNNVESEIARLSEFPDDYGPGHAEFLDDVVKSIISNSPPRYQTDTQGTKATHAAIFEIYDRMRLQHYSKSL